MAQPSPADSIHIAWWRWQLPHVLEAQFRRETDSERNQQIRWWHGVGMVVNGINFLLALWSVPELWQLSVLLYFGFVMPIMFVSRHLLAAPLPRLQEMVASFLPILATQLTLLTVFALSPAFEFAHSMSLLAMVVVGPARRSPCGFRKRCYSSRWRCRSAVRSMWSVSFFVMRLSSTRNLSSPA